MPQAQRGDNAAKRQSTESNGSGIALGPISLSFGTEFGDDQAASRMSGEASGSTAVDPPPSIHTLTTEEWRSRYEKDGSVDLWVEEEFNAGSRLVGGRAVHMGGTYGIRTGEGPSMSNAVKHKVKIFNHYANNVVDVEVPEDRYILWEAEDEGLELPYACRMGCCTVCAVRVKEGQMYQPDSLGLSAELRQGCSCDHHYDFCRLRVHSHARPDVFIPTTQGARLRIDVCGVSPDRPCPGDDT